LTIPKAKFLLPFLLALLLPTITWAQEREKILSPHIFKNAKGEISLMPLCLGVFVVKFMPPTRCPALAVF
jgi:hypothetical protein